MCHLETFISSCSERGDSLDPLHRLLPLWSKGVSAQNTTMLCTVEGRASLLWSQLHCCLLAAEQGGSAAWLLFHALTGGIAHLDWHSPKTDLSTSQSSSLYIPASSHSVHFSHCLNFTLCCSGISSLPLWWPCCNRHLWVLQPSTVLFLHCHAFAPRTSHLLIMLILISLPCCLYSFPFTSRPVPYTRVPSWNRCQTKPHRQVIENCHAAVCLNATRAIYTKYWNTIKTHAEVRVSVFVCNSGSQIL